MDQDAIYYISPPILSLLFYFLLKMISSRQSVKELKKIKSDINRHLSNSADAMENDWIGYVPFDQIPGYNKLFVSIDNFYITTKVELSKNGYVFTFFAENIPDGNIKKFPNYKRTKNIKKNVPHKKGTYLLYQWKAHTLIVKILDEGDIRVELYKKINHSQ